MAGVAAAKDKAVLVADAYLRITMTGWLALVLLVRLALAKVGMGHRLLVGKRASGTCGLLWVVAWAVAECSMPLARSWAAEAALCMCAPCC